MTTNDLIEEAISLPVEQRLALTESLLKSLNPPDEEIDQLWIEEASSRLESLRSGKTKPVSGAEVFAKIQDKFS